MTPFEYLQGIQDKIQSNGNISKPTIPQRIERTVNGKKWSDLTPVERFNNRKGRVDGTPQEQGLILDHTDFDILMLGRSILNAPKAIDALSREFNSNIKNSSQKTIANKLSVNQIDREVTNKGILSFKPTNTSLPEYMNNEQVYNNGDVATYLNKNSNKYVSVNGKKVKASTVELQEQTNGNVLLNGNLNIGKYEHINPKDSYIHIDDQIVGKSNINKPNIDSEGNLVGGKSSFKTNYVWWEKNSPYYKDRKANIRTLVTDSPGKVFDARDVTRFGSPNSVLSTKTDINNIIGYEHNPLTNYHSRVIYQQPITRDFNLKNINNFENISQNNLVNTNYGFTSNDILPQEVFDYKSYGIYPNKFNSVDSIKYSDIINEYKYGGIHIKKKNKGKLTATAKRTGKSFSELAHSKNPLTRKRAQFALNAKKFNHK